ncbi:MAG: isoprenylcysteine carboxylmethyltransferase family protein [Cyanobacteria bacterium REEB67]|nr:isoprenylcysteine carboxylmethyltransferase family protein [Cyanobacteria bacterium REEB67]
MTFNPPTIAAIILFGSGILAGIPVLAKGFSRRGKGIVYQSDFLLQRAPQLVSVLNIFLIVTSFLVCNDPVTTIPLPRLFSLVTTNPPTAFETVISWVGIAILLSGLIFMIGGWYSLGESFSTDAELLEGQKLREGGLLQFVMHPAYSGIIQCSIGGSLASLSPLCLCLTLFVIAPLWLRRAKYEEELLIKTFGDEYKKYAQKLKWRRLIPKFIPIGV